MSSTIRVSTYVGVAFLLIGSVVGGITDDWWWAVTAWIAAAAIIAAGGVDERRQRAYTLHAAADKLDHQAAAHNESHVRENSMSHLWQAYLAGFAAADEGFNTHCVAAPHSWDTVEDELRTSFEQWVATTTPVTPAGLHEELVSIISRHHPTADHVDEQTSAEAIADELQPVITTAIERHAALDWLTRNAAEHGLYESTAEPKDTRRR